MIAGTYDAYIREFAEGARDWGHPFFLRFNWEMNGDWFPWAERVNGNQPGEYVAAWRHVHDIFTAVGATNATWVWCPYADSKPRLGAAAPSSTPATNTSTGPASTASTGAANASTRSPGRASTRSSAPAYRDIVNKIAPDEADAARRDGLDRRRPRQGGLDRRDVRGAARPNTAASAA